MKNLKKLREEKGLSQQRLAELFSVSQQSIYKYENELAEPSIDLLIGLAKYFNTTIDYIVGSSDRRYVIENTDISDRDTRHLNAYRRLSGDMQVTLDALIEKIIEETDREK